MVITNQTNQPHDNIKVSVIMPAYNCADFVGATIEAVTRQSLKDLELIIVNDESTDQTKEVLEGYAQADSRIQVITVENGGPANARNVGIKQAKGEYLYFIDSDDLIHETMLEEMTALASKENLDVCVCGYTMENIATKKPFSKEFNYHDFVAYNTNEFREQLMPLMKVHMMYVVWNKLFKTSFIQSHDLLFADYLSGEDRLFNIKTFEHINRFGFIAKPFYRYFLRGQATLANRYVNNRFEAALLCHKALIEAYENMQLNSPQNKAYMDFIFIKGVMACITQLHSKKCPLSYKQKLDYIATILSNKYVKDALASNDDEISYSNKINAILKSGNKPIIYLVAKVIFILQFRFNQLFLDIKHKLK